MGAKAQKQAYGEFDKTWIGEHQMYFKGQQASAVLLAFVEPPEVVGPGIQHQLVIVTKLGISTYNWKTGKALKTLHMEIETADVATNLAGKKVLAYAGTNNIAFIAEPSTTESPKQVSFSEKVAVLKVIPGALLIAGFESGGISLVQLSDLSTSQVESAFPHPVSAFASASSLAVAGYRATQAEPRTKLLVFPTTQLSTDSSRTCEWLAGSCASICILESDSLILALAENTAKIEFWDLHNQNYLIGLSLSPTPLTCFLAQADPAQDPTLVLGGDGVTLGELRIGEDAMSWTPKRKSTLEGKAKVRLGRVTALQMEKALGLLVYGDDQGQAWLVDLTVTTSTSAAVPRNSTS